MTSNFRIEKIPTNLKIRTKPAIKIFAKSNDNLPIKIDTDKRYTVLYAIGEQFLEQIHNFEVRKDDIWVITQPKCGTTWALELVWLLKNNMDFQTALKVEQEERCRMLEFCCFVPDSKSIEAVDNMKSPRIIKTHLPIHVLPKALWTVKPKIIFVGRNPKDAIVSSYKYSNAVGLQELSKEIFIKAFVANSLIYCPFWMHIVEFWKLRNEPYVYFTSFERMKKDLRSVVLDICEFLQTEIKERDMNELLDHLSFEKMRDNPCVNHITETKLWQTYNKVEPVPYRFVNKGAIGHHKEFLNEKDIEAIDEWTKESLSPFNVTVEELLFK